MVKGGVVVMKLFRLEIRKFEAYANHILTDFLVQNHITVGQIHSVSIYLQN